MGLPAPPRRHRTPDRWSEEAIETALRQMIGKYGRWPTVKELRVEGLYGLYCAVSKSRPGREGWAKRLGVEPAYRHWTDKRIEKELRSLIDGGDSWPRSKNFQEAGLNGLYQKLLKEALLDIWAERLGVKRERRLRGQPRPSPPP